MWFVRDIGGRMRENNSSFGRDDAANAQLKDAVDLVM